MPSAWGQAAKAMMEYKGRTFTVGPQQPFDQNPELLAWSGVNSGPVVAWNDEKPINRWDDILLSSLGQFTYELRGVQFHSQTFTSALYYFQ